MKEKDYVRFVKDKYNGRQMLCALDIEGICVVWEPRKNYNLERLTEKQVSAEKTK